MNHDSLTVRLNGSAVRRLRHRLHMTQKMLAVAIGRYQPDISDMELGHMPHVYPATLQALAEALGVDMEELVTEDPRAGR